MKRKQGRKKRENRTWERKENFLLFDCKEKIKEKENRRENKRGVHGKYFLSKPGEKMGKKFSFPAIPFSSASSCAPLLCAKASLDLFSSYFTFSFLQLFLMLLTSRFTSCPLYYFGVLVSSRSKRSV